MIPRLARRHSAAEPDPAALEAKRSAPAGLPTRGLQPRAVDDATPATELLLSRLTDADLRQLADRLEPGYVGMLDGATPQERKRMTLSFGLLNGVEGVAEHTGLSAATPPPEVHSMVHGWVTEIGGSYYLGDMVLDMMSGIGSAPVAGTRVLDFSCSSGRVVRPLAAALPDVSWHGCDPNADAIAWARAHIPAVEFAVSPITPPLPFEDETFDLVFAISVWSHYSAAAALTWLEELRRLVRPGGHVLLSTHGLQACVWFTTHRDDAIERRLGRGWIDRTATGLQQHGHCFWDVFGKRGDWGVVDPEWGLAFFTPEWLLESITPAWALRSYKLGRAHGNQDVYVLERT